MTMPLGADGLHIYRSLDSAVFSAPGSSHSFVYLNEDGSWETLEVYRDRHLLRAKGFTRSAYIGDDEGLTQRNRASLDESIRTHRNRLAFLQAAKNKFDADIAEHKAAVEKAAEEKRKTEVDELYISIREIWINDPSPMAGDRIHRVAEHVHKLITEAKEMSL